MAQPARAPGLTRVCLCGGCGGCVPQELAEEQYVSALPFLPPLSEKTLNQYYTFYASFGGCACMHAWAAWLPMTSALVGLAGD
jgi:hypothetical protein